MTALTRPGRFGGLRAALGDPKRQMRFVTALIIVTGSRTAKVRMTEIGGLSLWSPTIWTPRRVITEPSMNTSPLAKLISWRMP